MKRKLIKLLVVCLLLSGCGISSSEPLPTELPATETTQSVFYPSLLEQGRVLMKTK